MNTAKDSRFHFLQKYWQLLLYLVFFVPPFSTISLPSHWFSSTIQNQRTYRCTTFWSPKPLHELLELSTFFCYCNDMFADFCSTINATSVTFKRPSFPSRETKNAVCRPCSNTVAVTFTRFFQDQTIIPHQRLGFFKHSFKNTQRNSIYTRIFDKLLVDPLIVE